MRSGCRIFSVSPTMRPAPTRPRSPEKSAPPICQLRPTFARRSKIITGNRNSGERPIRRRKAPAPIRGFLAGAGARKRPSAPTRPRSPKKSAPPSLQLRPTFARRRTSITDNPNSGEKPVRRRKAPAPIRGFLAGAGARKRPSAPTRPRSPKKSAPPSLQLRPTFSRRRTTNYRQPQLRREARSPEKGTSPDKGFPRRSRRL